MPEGIILSGPNPFKEKLRTWIILSFFLFFLILILVGFNLALAFPGRVR